jgi:hypothetical protein
MHAPDIFTHIPDDLIAIFEELRRREPIFHTPAFGSTIRDFESKLSPDYWEVGASGRRYSREFILHLFKQQPPVDAASAGWESRGFGLRRLGPNTYLLTYTLRQGHRLTRRSTIWEEVAAGQWRTLYHQGTIVTAEEDDAGPVPISG